MAKVKQTWPQTRYPSEQIISVVDGAKCYIGYATSITLEGMKTDTILMGLTKEDLRAACLRIDLNMAINEELFYRVVIVQEKHATLDDEL